MKVFWNILVMRGKRGNKYGDICYEDIDINNNILWNAEYKLDV